MPTRTRTGPTRALSELPGPESGPAHPAWRWPHCLYLHVHSPDRCSVRPIVAAASYLFPLNCLPPRSCLALLPPTFAGPYRARLQPPHVLALRLYTTAAFRSLNDPLRDAQRTEPHGFPATINCIAEGIRRLRAVSATREDAHTEVELWRGLADTTLPESRAPCTNPKTRLMPKLPTSIQRLHLRRKQNWP